jgi:hypothetical protein
MGLVIVLRPTVSKIAFHRNNPPSSTSSTMLRRAPLTPISGNKPPRKELDLLTKGKIAGQAELGAGPTQIGRSLNIPRTTVQSVLKRLETAPSGVNKPRPGRPTVITPRAARALLRYVRLNPKTTWVKLKRDTGLDVDRGTLRPTLEAHGMASP